MQLQPVEIAPNWRHRDGPSASEGGGTPAKGAKHSSGERPVASATVTLTSLVKSVHLLLFQHLEHRRIGQVTRFVEFVEVDPAGDTHTHTVLALRNTVWKVCGPGFAVAFARLFTVTKYADRCRVSATALVGYGTPRIQDFPGVAR